MKDGINMKDQVVYVVQEMFRTQAKKVTLVFDEKHKATITAISRHGHRDSYRVTTGLLNYAENKMLKRWRKMHLSEPGAAGLPYPFTIIIMPKQKRASRRTRA